MLIIKSKLPKSRYVYGGSNLWYRTGPFSDYPFRVPGGLTGIIPGHGIFDIAKNLLGKTAKSTLGKKVLQSSVGKKVLKTATVKNLTKAANSKLGKKLQKQVLSGVSAASQNAAEGAFQKLGVPVSKKRRIKRTSTKSKRRKGNGIVWE